MSEMRTEEEQIEAIKNWWQANGKSLLITVAVALAAVFGWKAWQQQQYSQSESASIAYQNLLDAVVVGLRGNDSEQLASSQHFAQQLKSEHGSTAYAELAALLMVKVAMQQGDYPRALSELDWVLDQQPSMHMQQVTRLRKARVYQAMKEYQQGLTQLEQVTAVPFAAVVDELRGDLYLALDEKAKARQAYTRALQNSAAPSPLLAIKLDDLATTEG